jgi:hypothetical protein
MKDLMGKRVQETGHDGHHHHYTEPPYPELCKREGHHDGCDHLTGDFHFHNPDKCDPDARDHQGDNFGPPCHCPEAVEWNPLDRRQLTP